MTSAIVAFPIDGSKVKCSQRHVWLLKHDMDETLCAH